MRFDLGSYLQRQNLSVNQLVKEVKGKVAPSTVYGLARRSIYRLDLDIVSKLLDGLSRLEGRKVIITDLIEKTDH